MPKKTSTPSFNKPPVVTIMGHVDHGKTTLLDKIRHSTLTAAEAGGITQHIGAYQVEHLGQKITFIDTPGHAAFSKMRAHGAQVTDIAILVVAANDGVKPQTKESIHHIQDAGVPMIVAINKIDVTGASPDMVKAQLTEDGVQVEGFGGSVPVVEISALQGKGIDKLLETITILAEMEELKADPHAPLEAVIIESHQEKNLGPIVTLLVKQGTLTSQSKLISATGPETITGTAKRLLSDLGKIIITATPGDPVELLGLKSVPPVGTIFTTIGNEATITAKYHVEPAPETPPEPEPEVVEPPPAAPVAEGTEEEAPAVPEAPAEIVVKPNIKVILISDTVGTLEAITQNIGDEIELIKTGTGQVTESDILLAQSTGAAIIAFNTPIKKAARKLAEIERVPVKSYAIIYKLLEDLENQVLKLLEPTFDEEELGVASVKQVFHIKDTTIAGCSVDSGSITVNSKVHLKRGLRFINDATITSLKYGKDDTSTAKAGTECGISLKPALDIKPSDKLISFKKIVTD